jgi:hypothetical protein
LSQTGLGLVIKAEISNTNRITTKYAGKSLFARFKKNPFFERIVHYRHQVADYYKKTSTPRKPLLKPAIPK